MLSKEQEREQRIQAGIDTIQKVKASIYELCSKIGEIDQDVLKFIVRDVNNIPSKSDIVRAHPDIEQNIELACNIVELYKIFGLKSEIIHQSVKKNSCACWAMQEITIPQVLSEVRTSLLDVTSVSEISTSTLDTTLGTNSSVLHGSFEYCEL